MNPIYEYTVPMFKKMLHNLSGLLEKGEAYAKEKGMSESELLDSRMAPDMFPLVKQIQMCCDNAKGASARLAGVENPKHEDMETSFSQLKERVKKTLAFLETIEPEQFEDAEDRQVVLPYFPDKYLDGSVYAKEYAIPNFLFHVTTTYALLRKAGVQVGKADYLGHLDFKDLAS